MLFQLTAAAVLGSVALAFFLGLEHRGRRHVTLGIVLGALFVEALLNGSEYSVPAGLFRIPAGPADVRQVDLIMVVALGARFLAGGSLRRVTAAGLAWTGFLLYYATAAVAGVLYGNSSVEVGFQGRSVFYLGGLMILAAGTPLAPLVRARTMRRWAVVLAVAGAAGLALGLAGLAWPVNAGPLSLREVGRFNNDVITLLLAFGAVVLLVEATRHRRPWWVAAAGLVLLCQPFGGSQRANFLSLAAVLGVMGLAAVGTTWRRRVRATPLEATAIVGLVILLVAGGALYSGASGEILRRVQGTFFSSQEAATTSAREGLYSQAIERIGQRPLFGFGLGTRVVLDDGYTEEREVTAHNIVLDVGTRSGLVGVGLLGLALAASAADALKLWRRHPNDQIAAFALGMLVVVAAIVGKGMVESTFEKYRLNVGLGLALGLIAAGLASLRTGVDRHLPDETAGEPAGPHPDAAPAGTAPGAGGGAGAALSAARPWPAPSPGPGATRPRPAGRAGSWSPPPRRGRR